MLILKWTDIFDINTGETFKAMDSTGPYDSALNPGGYGAPNIEMSDVNATRMIFGSYLKDQTATTSTEIVSSVEYIVGGTGSFVWDTKTYAVNDTFISMLDGTPTLGTCTLTQTGRYCPVIDFVPSDVESDDFTPSLLGIDDTIFPDSTYSCQYEIYTTVYAAGVLRPAGQYIVIGTPGQLATVSGVTYRIGEVFEQGSTFTNSGSASIVLYYTALLDSNDNVKSEPFLLNYYAYQTRKTLTLQITNSGCACKKESEAKLQTINNNMDAIDINFENTLNLDISGTQILLDEVVLLGQNLCNC